MIRAASDFCAQCGRFLDTPHAIDQHNLTCAHTGERAYAEPPRTFDTPAPFPLPRRNAKRIPR